MASVSPHYGRMAERLGEVLYWTGCLVAALCLGLAFLVWRNASGADYGVVVGLFISAAVVAWLIGRACRYILSNR